MLGILNRRMLTTLALAGVTLWTSAGGARADLILALGQKGPGTPITATNPTSTSTQITATDVAVTITFIDPASAVTTPVDAYLTLSALSTSGVTSNGSDYRQEFGNGVFSVFSGLGKTGINYLSGLFNDAVFGSGTGLTMTASAPTAGENVVFTSDVIPLNHLLTPRALSFAFAGVNPALPPVDINNLPLTLPAFNAGVSATFSATAVPEPATVATAISGLLVLGGTTLLRRRSAR